MSYDRTNGKIKLLEQKMKLIGIIKTVDKFGRVSIPKDLRELFGLYDKAELIPTEEGLLIRRYKANANNEIKNNN